MGAAESTQNEDKYFGFRVYKVIEGGPLFNAGVRELEDFIIPPADVFSNKIPFYDYIRQHAGKKISLNIYSLPRRYFFTVEITPHDDWCDNRDQGYLGASVRYENWSSADKCLLRVLKVLDNSPAQKKLALVPLEDFIIALRPNGEDIFTLNKDDADPLTLFSNFIALCRGKLVEFFIFNCKKGGRSVKVQLNDDVLGCDVAYGKLHEFPKLVQTKEETPAPVRKVENLDRLDREGAQTEKEVNGLSPVIRKEINYTQNQVKEEEDKTKEEEEDDIVIVDESEKK